MTTETVYFKRANGMTEQINEYEAKGWTVKIVTPFYDGGYRTGSSTAGLMVTFERLL